MKEDKVMLLLRVKESYNAACRCINSIRRQSCDAYEIRVIAYTQELAEDLKETYPELDFCIAEGNKGCKNQFNSYISETTARYCMFVDSDSVLATDTVEKILKFNDELIVFNVSKPNKNEKFSNCYKKDSFESVAAFMEEKQSIWAIAFDPEFIRKNEIKLKGIGYEKQALFLLMCLSLSKSVTFDESTYIYKWIVSKKKDISPMFYYKNREDVSRAMKGFSEKGDNEAKIKLIKHFLLPEIEESYNRSFLRKMKKMLALIRLIWFC